MTGDESGHAAAAVRRWTTPIPDEEYRDGLKSGPRLREFFRLAETIVVSHIRYKIHQTCRPFFSPSPVRIKAPRSSSRDRHRRPIASFSASSTVHLITAYEIPRCTFSFNIYAYSTTYARKFRPIYMCTHSHAVWARPNARPAREQKLESNMGEKKKKGECLYDVSIWKRDCPTE